MPSDYIGKYRAEALYRFVFLVAIAWWLIPTLLGVTLLIALVWMVIDVLMQLLFNRQGWNPGGMGASAKNFGERLVYWPVDMAEWTIFGSRDFPWLP